MTVATTILEQLGGRQFMLMTGAKNLLDHGDALSMRIGRNAKRVNYVKVTLTPMDEYDMEFGYVTACDYVVRERVTGVYNDMLKDVFEFETELYVSLHAR